MWNVSVLYISGTIHHSLLKVEHKTKCLIKSTKLQCFTTIFLPLGNIKILKRLGEKQWPYWELEPGPVVLVVTDFPLVCTTAPATPGLHINLIDLHYINLLYNIFRSGMQARLFELCWYYNIMRLHHPPPSPRPSHTLSILSPCQCQCSGVKQTSATHNINIPGKGGWSLTVFINLYCSA